MTDKIQMSDEAQTHITLNRTPWLVLGFCLPPIYRDCCRLLAHTEEVVRRFD
jgi:hypothetical protein